jgi:hypothetical protein
MARTDAGTALTEEHRQAQAGLRTHALRDFLLLWPLWNGDPASFGQLVQATQPLVRVYHGLSATVAAAYYEAFRKAEAVTGTATPKLAAALDPAAVAASMYVTGQTMARNALGAGQSPEQVRKSALVRVSGSVTRHVLAGGRDTILQSVAADPEALGWARVTDGDPCAFCAMIASRGPVFKTEAAADFQAHDYCACVAEPAYKGSKWPGNGREYRKIYNRSIRDAAAAGELDRGTSNDLLNAFRRVYDAQRPSNT